MSEAELQALVRSIEELRNSTVELRESQRETDRVLRQSKEETDRALRQSKEETDRAIRDLSGLFTTQWGKLVEALVEPGCIDEFRKRGIAITRSMQRAEGIDSAGRQMEIDVLLIDGKEVVAVEVKTTCKISDVEEHEERLERFKEAFPEYRDKTVYGAVAGLTFESQSDKYAYRRGLYVLKPIDGLAKIANDEKFQPKAF